MARIEAVRVAQDASYAATLTDADWYTLSQDPEWQQMVAEQAEMVAPVLAAHGHKIPGGVNETPNEIPPVAPFKVIGTDIARMQGFGIVTGEAKYTEHMT